MFKLPFLSLVIAVAVSSSVTFCDFCDGPNDPPTPDSEIGAVHTAPSSAAGAIPRG